MHRTFHETPLTEMVSPLSLDLDILSVNESLKVLHRCEMQLFGDDVYTGIFEPNFVTRLVQFRDAIATSQDPCILLAGAGTSGRLCRLLSLESLIRHPVLATLPGGTRALKLSKPMGEDYEDDGIEDAEVLASLFPGRPLFAVGVTCGLSAKYVEGFIGNIRQYDSAIPSAILGFNPKEQTRIELFQSSSRPETTLLNPMVGPEAIAGSVRMKGATATLIILHALLSNISDIGNRQGMFQTFNRMRETLSLLMGLNDFLEKIISAATFSLGNSGHIYSIGEKAYGALCLFDAAECVPTFGADPETYQGFVEGGWEYLHGSHGCDSAIPSSPISHSYFLEKIAPRLTLYDTVLIIAPQSRYSLNILLQASARCPNVFVISPPGSEAEMSHEQSVSLETIGIKGKWESYLAIRSVLVRISTVAFTQNGALYGNRMIDLRLTNHKLFRRGVHLLMDLAGASEEDATSAIARAISERDNQLLPANQEEISELIMVASERKKIVPKAFYLLADPHLTVAEVQTKVNQMPVVRSGLDRRH